jgi:hypothetical protein
MFAAKQLNQIDLTPMGSQLDENALEVQTEQKGSHAAVPRRTMNVQPSIIAKWQIVVSPKNDQVTADSRRYGNMPSNVALRKQQVEW